MRALLGRELRGATLWAALQALFGVLANLDHALWRPAHTTTEASLHVFDGEGATARGDGAEAGASAPGEARKECGRTAPIRSGRRGASGTVSGGGRGP